MRAVMWFRRDLSLADNLAWVDALASHDHVLALYVLDDRLLDPAGPHRRAWFERALDEFAVGLSRRGIDLVVVGGDPVTEVPRAAREHGAGCVYWNRDVTRYAKARDHAVERALAEHDVAVTTAWSTLVHPPGSITTAAGTVPKVFTRFYEKWDALEIEPPAGAQGADATALDAFLERVDRYDDERDDIALDSTSRLSADLRFGTVSPRAVVRAVGRSTPGRRAFVRQLAWRDWYAHLWWERDDLVDRSMQPSFERIDWRNDPDEIEAWRTGNTGVPIVDAGMRQLLHTGWLPNRARMIVASFLVKDLLVDWRIGERHFRHLLVDGDVPQNAGNWQWAAGTGPDAAPYFRVLNPLTQARRFDPDGRYVRAWLPELAGIAGSGIHTPWTLGPLELAAAGVTLGETYAWPVVEHGPARERALAAYAHARGSARA